MLVEMLILVILLFFPVISYHIYDKLIKIEPHIQQVTILDHNNKPNWNFVLCPYVSSRCVELNVWGDLENMKQEIKLDVLQSENDGTYVSILNEPLQLQKQYSRHRLDITNKLTNTELQNSILIQTTAPIQCRTPLIVQLKFVSNS
jgi:hypothetical protein